MKRSLGVRALVAGVTAALALSACAGPSDDPGDGDAAKGTVNVFMYQKPAGVFSPIAPASGPDQQVLSLIYESLLAATPDGRLEPGLAASLPTISDDARTVTFKLRDGLTWSDG